MSPANDPTRPGDAKSRITRTDIEEKLRQFAGPVEEGVDRAKSVGAAAAVAVGAVLVIGAYLFGRRRGKKRVPVVEIRRI